MPTSDVRLIDTAYLRDLMRDVEFLFPIPEEWLAAFNAEEFEVTFAEGDADYVYTVEKMSTYRGRRLHKNLRQFLALALGSALTTTHR
jgi:hypothetical protein